VGRLRLRAERVRRLLGYEGGDPFSLADAFVVPCRDGVRRLGAVPPVAVEVASGVVASERARNAVSNCSGSFRPLRSARRSIPAAALGLKENLEGAWLSKTSDKVHATAPLGDSEVTAVQDTPRKAVPEFGDRFDDLPEVLTFMGRDKSWYLLHKKPART
jgi:hypothetical protein